MPESADDITPKKSRGRGRRKSAPVATVDLGTRYLASQLRTDAPGQATDNRLSQSQHNDGVTYVAVNALMTAIRSSTVTINRKRKPIARDSENRITKALPTPGTSSTKEDSVPLTDDSHDLVRLFARPNPTETINELLAQLVQQIMLTGSGMLWANPDKLGLPRELYVMPTALMQAQPPAPAYPYGYYRVTQYYPAGAYGMLPYPGSGGGVPIDCRDILRFKMPHPLWRWDALSPLTAGSVQLTILEAIDQARFSAMEGGLTTDAFILAPGMDQEQMNAWLEQLKQNNFGKRNHRKTVALGGGVGQDAKFDVKFPHVSAKDMDYSTGWDQMTAFALALFGVPKAVANLAGASSYAELYAALKQFHTLTLVPLAQWLSQWLTRHLCYDCYGEDLTISIDVPAIDDKEMSERMVGTQLSNGLLTYNEGRAHYNLAPVEGGDVIASIYVKLQEQKAMPQPQPGQPGEQPAPQGSDPLAALTGGGAAEAVPDEGGGTEPSSSLTGSESESDDADTEEGVRDATVAAALAALGMPAGGPGGSLLAADDNAESAETDESDDTIPQNRIKAYPPAHLTNGHLAAWLKANPGIAPQKQTHSKHREGEKFESKGKWYVIRNGRAVHTTAPGGGAKPAPRDESPASAPAQPAPAAPSPDLDAAAKAILGGHNYVKQFVGYKPFEIRDGASLKQFLDAGGELSPESSLRLKVAGIALPSSAPAQPDSAPLPPPTPAETASVKAGGAVPPKRVAAAAASIPAASPVAKQTLSTASHWADAHAAKHADALAKHFGISPKKAHAILVRAIEAVASHALRTGQRASIKISHGGKTATLREKPKSSSAPAPSRVGPGQSKTGKITGAPVPTVPKPANRDGRGSLPPKPSFRQAPKETGDARLRSQIKSEDVPVEFDYPQFGKGLSQHDYGCVLLRVSPEVASRVQEVAARIPDDELAPDGRESDPHVTVLFGLTDTDPEPVASALAASPPVALAFGKYRLFSSDRHDVLYVAVESQSLRRLNSALRSLPHESTHRDYVPHMTVAYLKPGAGAAWVARLGAFGGSDTVSEVVFSDANGTEHPIPLVGGTVEKSAMSALTDSLGGALVAPASTAPTIPLKRLATRGKRKRRTLSDVCKDALAELDSAAPADDLEPAAVFKALGALAPLF